MANTRERKVPALVDKPMDFCPGCGHGIVSRLIMECLEELEQLDNIIFPIGVGCSSNPSLHLNRARYLYFHKYQR